MATAKARIAKITAECSGVWSTFGVTSWERARLEEWKDFTTLSPKQEKILCEIEAKVFDGEGEATASDDD